MGCEMKARAGSGISLEEYLTYLDTQGEFNNKMDKPLQELISNGTAYAVGKMGEELVLPLPITLMLSLGAGVTVSLTAGKYVFKDSAGNVVLEAGADEVDGIRTQIKQGVENGSDALEGGSKTVDINNPVLDNIRTGSALKGDSLHAFNDIIDNYAGDATKFSLTGGDGVERTLYQLEGSLNGKQGIFEWIVDPDPTKGVTHRRFIEGVGITGKPNARP